MCPKPKLQTVETKVADPTPVAVTNMDTQVEGSDKTAADKQRRKRGYSSTQASTILGTLNNDKQTLG